MKIIENQVPVEIIESDFISKMLAILDNSKKYIQSKELTPKKIVTMGLVVAITLILLLLAHFLKSLFLFSDILELFGLYFVLDFSYKNLLYAESRKKLKSTSITKFTNLTKKIKG